LNAEVNELVSKQELVTPVWPNIFSSPSVSRSIFLRCVARCVTARMGPVDGVITLVDPVTSLTNGMSAPSRLAGSSDKLARSRGRVTSPLNLAGTVLVARNGSCPRPGKVPVPSARWLERGWIKAPYPRRFSPHSGDTHNGESVRSLSAGRKRCTSRHRHPDVIAVC
jgi:hypothetical protein